MRKFLALLLATLMLLAVVGCTAPTADGQKDAADDKKTEAPADGKTEDNKTEDNKPTSGERRKLRVAAESWQVTKIFLEDAAAAFMKDHPDVDVEVITYADTSVLSTYTLNWMQDTTDVDIVFIDGGVKFAKQFDAKGLICDFDKDLNFFNYVSQDQFCNGVLEYGKVQGRQVALPIIQEVYAISCNVDMFKAAGLVDEQGNCLQPKDWDEFYEFAKKLTIRDANGNVTQQGASIQFGNNLLTIIASSLAGVKGNITLDDGVTYDIDNDEFRAIVANWQKGVQEGVYSIATFADNSGGRNALKAGTLAMCYEAAGRWMEAENMLGAGTMTLANPPGGKGTLGFGGDIVVPKCSPNQDLVCQFVAEQLLGEHVQTNTFTQYGKMSVIKSYFDAAIEAVPIWANIKDSMDKAIGAPSYNEEQKFLDGACAIFQAGLVDPNTTADQIVNELVELMNSVDK